MKNSITFQRILAVLDAAPIKYKIVFPDGSTAGDLEIVDTSIKKRKLRRPRGTMSSYIDPFIEGMIVGEIRRVPLPVGMENFEPHYLTSGVGNRAIIKWGVSSARVSSDASGVEVMRLK